MQKIGFPVFLLAPDSFKGSLSAYQACRTMEQALRRVCPQARFIYRPMADGGEGTVEALVAATGGSIHQLTVTGPLGEPVQGYYGISGDQQTAFIDTTAASGFALSDGTSSNVRQATTYGTGELFKACLDQGLRRFMLGLGGSATNDGGSGFLQALGIKFLDEAGEELPFGGEALRDLHTIDPSGLDPRVGSAIIEVLSDVDNPLTGANGASAIYGPQKGATKEDVLLLDDALRHYGRIVQESAGRDCKDESGAGAAGGLGFALLSFTSAILVPGAERIAQALGLNEAVRQADYILTGEGRLDQQTLAGKTAATVARLAQSNTKPIIAFGGTVDSESIPLLQTLFDVIVPITPSGVPLEEALLGAETYLEEAVYAFFRGRQLKVSSSQLS